MRTSCPTISYWTCALHLKHLIPHTCRDDTRERHKKFHVPRPTTAGYIVILISALRDMPLMVVNTFTSFLKAYSIVYSYELFIRGQLGHSKHARLGLPLIPHFKMCIPSARASTASSLPRFLKLNMARYLSNKLRLSSRRHRFRTSTLWCSTKGGAGSTDLYGASEICSPAAWLCNHSIRDTASLQVSDTWKLKIIVSPY